MRPAAGTASLGVVLVLVAGMFDAEPLYVPGVAFVALAAVASAWVRLAAGGAVVRRTIAARRVVEDEPLEVTIHARAGRVPVPGGALVDPLLDGDVPLPPGRRGRRVRVDVRFDRRGRRALEPPELVVRDPLGLAERRVRGADGDEVLVLPRVEPVRSLRPDEGRRRTRRSGRPAIAAEVEVDGVREHRQGTPASRIYWPALARGSGLMERRLRADADSTPLVVLDTRGVPADPPEELADALDAAVRAAASLVVAMARDGGAGLLLPGDRRPTMLDESLAGWPHLHARLALVAPGPRVSLSGVASRAGLVVYVAALPPRRAPRALEHAPAAGRVLVVPGTLPGQRPLFSVAGCHGYDVGASRGRRRGRAAA